MTLKKLTPIYFIAMAVLIILAQSSHAQEGGQSATNGANTAPGGQPQNAQLYYADKNMLLNGNFEFGFYGIPYMGAELLEFPTEGAPLIYPQVSRAPNSWDWFKNDQAAGRYQMVDRSAETSIIGVCPDDVAPSLSSLVLFMQATDQPNARLGIYQTVDVTPGQDYYFSILGLILTEPALVSPSPTHSIQIAFVHYETDDWRSVPEEDWISIKWPEQRPSFAGQTFPVENYLATLTAERDKMTVFVSFVRTLPNHRSSIVYLDCLGLYPKDVVLRDDLIFLRNYSAVSVDVALNGLDTLVPTKLVPPGSRPLPPPTPTATPLPPLPHAYPPEFTAAQRGETGEASPADLPLTGQ